MALGSRKRLDHERLTVYESRRGMGEVSDR